MVRVFVSRYSGGLRPGDGDKVNFATGETVLIISGQDAGRRFVLTSESRTHADAPPGEFVREGYFEDDVTRTSWAILEKQLWFTPETEREIAGAQAELGI